MASLIDRALKSHQSGKIKDAVKLYRRVLADEPRNLRVLANLGTAYLQLDMYEPAAKVLKRAAELAPTDAEIGTHLGLAYFYAGNLDQAADTLQAALHRDSTAPGANNGMGLVLVQQGNAEAALAYFERSLVRLPDDLGIRQNYAVALDRSGRQADAAKIYQSLTKDLIERKFFDAAKDAAAGWAKISPDDADAYTALGIATVALGDNAGGREALARAAEVAPDVFEIQERFGQFLMDIGDFAAAKTVLTEAHARHSRRSGLLGNLAIALRELDDPALDYYVNYDAYLWKTEIETPFGFKDLDDFNQKLHEKVASLHMDNDSGYQTMRGGTQNAGFLFDNKENEILQLKAQISRAIKAYVARIGDDPTHPFERYKRLDFGFMDAWSTILVSGGYDGSHIHPEGWLSGVYHVKVPTLDEARRAAGEGCLQLGAPPPKYESPKNTVARFVRPHAGSLVLFPSYFWHGVIPYTSNDERHAIAFDVR